MVIIEILSVILNLSICADTLTLYEFKDTINFETAVYDNSILVISNEKILKRKTDYLFSNGMIIFVDTVLSPIMVIYERTGDEVGYLYRKHSKIRNEELVIGRENGEKEISDVSINGVKSFLISSQSGNVSMDQSLDVSVNGKISKDWTVEGKIYDNTSDINSTSLNSPLSRLENIYMSIYSQKNKIILGNGLFSGFSNEMSLFNREIFGITSEFENIRIPFSLSAAGQKGRFSSISFYCSSNIQGPYKITENAQLSMYVIAPHSERIYLNGEILKSGEENDYTINYFTGEVIFTLRHIVDDRSYIYAEFQLYEELSPVTGYFFKAGKDTSGFSVFYSHEEQSVLNEETKEILKNIPTDSSYFRMNGFSYVGMGNGDYSLSDSVFVFSGSGNGDYMVDFYYVGYGKGDYAYSPVMNCYVYSGESNGNYSIYKDMALPFSSDYLSLFHSQNTPIGNFSLEASNGFFKNNRYSLKDKKESGLSCKAKYQSKLISFGNIIFDFSIEKDSRSDVYRNKWSSSSSEDEIISNVIKSRYAKNESRFKEKIRYNNIFTLEGYYGFLDSLDDAYFKLSSDTLFDLFSSFEKRRTYMADSVLYDMYNLTGGRRFSHFVSYCYIKNEMNINDRSRQNGAVFFMRNLPLREEYIYEERFSDTVKKYVSNILRSEFSKSWDAVRTSILCEYQRVENLSSNVLSNRFGLSSNIGVLLGQKFSSNNMLRITSLSTYIDIETYVFVGEGKGNYIYDKETDSYIYDEIYGNYIKITERDVSKDPVTERDASLNLKSSISPADVSFDISYRDASKSFFDFDSSAFVSKSLFSSLLSSYSILENLKLFTDIFYSDNFTENISSYYSLKTEGGIRGDKIPFPYSVSCIYSKEEQNYYAGRYYLKSLLGKGMINPYQDRNNYDVEMVFGTFSGDYNFLTGEPATINGRTLSFSVMSTFILLNHLSSVVNPSVTYNEYDNGNSDPLVIHYKYPEGFSINSKLSLMYSNDFLNLTISYINDFDKRYGFRQRVETSLFSYF